MARRRSDDNDEHKKQEHIGQDGDDEDEGRPKALVN
jgi:hypothetical protein